MPFWHKLVGNNDELSQYGIKWYQKTFGYSFDIYLITTALKH